LQQLHKICRLMRMQWWPYFLTPFSRSCLFLLWFGSWLCCKYMNTLEAFHMMCQQQILYTHWWAHVSSGEKAPHIWFVNHCLPTYIIVTICLATLHAWTLEYQHTMLCVWWRIHTRAESQLEKTAGRPRNVWLDKVQDDADHGGDRRLSGVTEWCKRSTQTTRQWRCGVSYKCGSQMGRQ